MPNLPAVRMGCRQVDLRLAVGEVAGEGELELGRVDAWRTFAKASFTGSSAAIFSNVPTGHLDVRPRLGRDLITQAQLPLRSDTVRNEFLTQNFYVFHRIFLFLSTVLISYSANAPSSSHELTVGP